MPLLALGAFRTLAAASAGLMAALLAAHSFGQDIPPAKYREWSWEKEIFVPMRDGARLSTDVLLPKGAEGKLPTVLVRTPYHKDNTHWALFGPWDRLFLEQGYALVIMNERGRHFSEGDYEDYLEGASTDGYDSVDWVVKQPWSNGKLGTFGCSSSGEQQWPMAASNHPGHAAMLPLASGTAIGDVPGNDTRGAIYRGGVPMIGLWAWWYHDMATSERLLLPPNTTQEQRIRLRNSFSLQPMTHFYPLVDGTINSSKQKNPIRPALEALPSQDVIRNLGGALTPFDKYLTWGPADPRWDEVEQIGAGDKPRVPALHHNTWHDVGVGEMIRLFQYLQDMGTPNQYLIIGSGPHCAALAEETMADLSFGDLEVGDARYGGLDRGYAKLFLNWYDYWLKGEKNDVVKMPKVQLHVMGKGWVSGDRWPLESTRFVNYYLDSDGRAGSRMDSGALAVGRPAGAPFDEYRYDPSMPVPSRGGGCCGDDIALDQREVEMRSDVLTYTSPPLEEGLTLAGPIEVVLHVSSSAKDTDFMVKLVHVYPDGKAINLADDAIRARYREGFDKQLFMQPDGIYEVRLTNMVTANHFPAGHRIRLDLTSSNFPVFERNLNTGGSNHDETEWVVADNRIHHSPAHPSRVLLPVIPE